MYLSCRVFFGGGFCFYEWPLCFISGSPCWLGQARVSQNYCKMFRRKMSEISEFVLSLVNGAINHTFPALFVSLIYIKYWKGRQNKVMGKMWGFCPGPVLFLITLSCSVQFVSYSCIYLGFHHLCLVGIMSGLVVLCIIILSWVKVLHVYFQCFTLPRLHFLFYLVSTTFL